MGNNTRDNVKTEKGKVKTEIVKFNTFQNP